MRFSLKPSTVVSSLQGLLRPLRVLEQLRQDGLHSGGRGAHPGHRVRPKNPQQEGQLRAGVLAQRLTVTAQAGPSDSSSLQGLGKAVV